MPYYNNDEISEFLSQYGGGDPYKEKSILDSMLKNQQISQEDYDRFSAGPNGNIRTDIAGKGLAALDAGLTIGSGMMRATDINEIPQYDSQINTIRNAGNSNYSNFEQLSNEYAQTNYTPNFNYDDVRGMSKMDKIGSIGTSALTGGMTGLKIGGLPGAIVGTVGGGLLQWGANKLGDNYARGYVDTKRARASLATDAAEQNFSAAHERILDNNNRRNAVHMNAYGGQMKQQSIKDFADRVLNNPQRKNWRPSSDIVRTHGEGGTCIRIKVK